MGAKSAWQASSVGPDWTDVSTMMRAVADLHQVNIALVIGPGVFDGPSLFGTLQALHQPKEGNLMGQPVAAVSFEFPCATHKELTSCVYAGLYDLDFLLSSKVWKQSSLPFTAE